MSARILVLFAHPALERSRVHRRLLGATRRVVGVTVRDLYELYPELDIDVEAEQEALASHDVIVFQHPLYWYSVPPILRQWQDLVLEHGWAFGHDGNELSGKATLHVLSSGSGERAYQGVGSLGTTIDELLRPFALTAWLCKMRWLAPYCVYGAHGITEPDLNHHELRYTHLLRALSENRLDQAVAAQPGGMAKALELYIAQSEARV